MRKSKHTFARQLSISLMLMAIPIFILSLGTFLYRSSYLIDKKNDERIASTLNATVQRVVNYMNAIKTAAHANAWLVEDNFTPDSLPAITRHIVSRNPNVQGCSVNTEPNMLPKAGRFFCVYSFRSKTVNGKDTIETIAEPANEYYDQNWYKTALRTGKGHWDDPFDIILKQGSSSIAYHGAMASYNIPLYITVKFEVCNNVIIGFISGNVAFHKSAFAYTSNASNENHTIIFKHIRKPMKLIVSACEIWRN